MKIKELFTFYKDNIITNYKNVIKKNFPVAEKFFGFAEKRKNFYKFCFFKRKKFLEKFFGTKIRKKKGKKPFKF